MRNIDLAWRAAAIISALCLSGACVVARLWQLAPGPALLAVIWLAAKGPGPRLHPALYLSGNTALAALGVHLHLSAPLLVLGITAALAAWDLAHFAGRLRLAVSGEHRTLLVRAHLPSLVLAIACGLLLALLASVVRLQLPFGVVSLLALGLVLAISGIPRAIRRGGGPSSTP